MGQHKLEPDPLMIQLGAIMRKRRKHMRLNQVTLAKMMGTSQQSLSGWEQGKVSPPWPTAVRWCEALGYDLWPFEPGVF